MKKRGRNFARKRDGGAFARAMCANRPLDYDQQRDLSVGFHAAIQCIKTGHGTDAHAHTIAAVVNVALLLSEIGVGNQYIDDIKNAQHAVLRLFERGARTDAWVFDGDGLRDIEHAACVHDAQLEIATSAEIGAAIAEMKRRINNGDVFNVRHLP